MTKHSQISVSTCNINVLHHKTIDDKTTNQHFVNSIKHHDFIFLTETWSDAATVISDFKAICTRTATSKSKRSCHISCGITLFVKNECQNIVTIADQTTNTLWCKINKTIANYEQDVYLCGIYIPPVNSHYFDEEIFDNLENDIIYFSKK